MANVYKTKLDIKNVSPSFKPVFVQYDHARLEIELTDDGQPYDLSTVERVEFTHVRSDGAVIIHSAEIVTNGNKKIIRYTYQGTEMDTLGLIDVSFAVFDADNKKVSSHTFNVTIVKDLREELFEPSEPNYGLLQTLISDVEYVKQNGNSANVTNANVIDALGYTPTKAADITWENVLNKPTTFTPSAHSHSYNDLTNKPTIPTLNNTVTSTSTTQAATANAVKLAYDRAEMAFTQASDGKSLIANAITGKGGTATNTDTFAQLSSAITNIPTGKRSASGTFTATRVVSDTTIGFSPSVVIVRGKYVKNDTYVLSTYIKAAIDTTPANILNSYTLSASTTIIELFDSIMVATADGFALSITSIGEYSGMWVAYE